jgi:hypothetical protein
MISYCHLLPIISGVGPSGLSGSKPAAPALAHKFVCFLEQDIDCYRLQVWHP